MTEFDDEDDDRWRSLTALRIERRDRAALGTLAIAVHELEEWIGFSIAMLLGCPDDTDVFATRLQFQVKQQLVGSLILRRLERDAPGIEHWKAIAARVDRVRDSRNHFVHSRWEVEGPFMQPVAIKRRADKESIDRPVDAEDLYAMAREAETLCDELIALTMRLSRET